MIRLNYEELWQKKWREEKCYEAKVEDSKHKYFVLDMFPYPSGTGLHVGHVLGYTGTEIMARYKKMQGFNVLHPMGWDAFGLPAEQYALKTGNDPRDFTLKNIEVFKKQLNKIGLVYDWTKEIKTIDKEYYKWTQWIFIQLYKLGLAELKNVDVNWCEQLGTVLANEEIENVDGKMVSEVGGYPVIKKPMKQWVLKITHYAQRLLDDLDDLDWPDSLKEMQRNWIGRSEGAMIDFTVEDKCLSAFTTRADTVFGASYVVISPEHPLTLKLTTKEQEEEVKAYITKAKLKTELDRMETNKDKTGVFTGSYVLNPATKRKVPLWVGDYVLMTYGTGIVMGCPAHDSRDYEFAKKYELPIIQVLEGNLDSGAIVDDAKHINSEFLNGLYIEEANEKMYSWLEEHKFGKRQINYKLRDWIFSRQRYWGEPFPVLHHMDGTVGIIEDLPVELPTMDNVKPSGTGESPLANNKEWLEVKQTDGTISKRETNTMPQWAGSCWYYIGYLLKKSDGLIPLDSAEAKVILDEWLPVDLYVGGAEHAVLHLLYARFWHKVLYDIGVVSSKEPFQKLVNQGMVLGEDHEKMSKSKGNGVDPLTIIEEYNADVLRMYVMFMGPLTASKPWSNKGINGIQRFIEKIKKTYQEVEVVSENDLDARYHSLVKEVTSDYEKIKYNTAISKMMVFLNEINQTKTVTEEQRLGYLKLLFPIIPHICEELNYIVLGNETLLANMPWPSFEESKIIKSTMQIIVQVNGKLRSRLEVSAEATKEDILKLAITDEKIMAFIEGKKVVKEIYVPNKLVNLVVN